MDIGSTFLSQNEAAIDTRRCEIYSPVIPLSILIVLNVDGRFLTNEIRDAHISYDKPIDSRGDGSSLTDRLHGVNGPYGTFVISDTDNRDFLWYKPLIEILDADSSGSNTSIDVVLVLESIECTGCGAISS